MSPTLTSSLLTLLCASASLVAASEPLTIPLEKRNLVPLATEAGVVIKDNLLQTLEFTKQKYHATLVNYQINHDGTPYPGTPKLELSRGPGKKGNGKRDGSVPLRPLSGSALWAGDIQVGGQTFRIDFDTGSSDLWIPSVNCTSPACQCTGTNCDRKNKFDCTKSKTCIPYPDKNFTISYVDGSGVRGKQYNDTVTVGGISGGNTTFSAVDTMDTTLDEDAVDGIMGMGYQLISNLKQRPVFQNLYARNTTRFSSNMFSFFFSDEDTGSELYLGGVNNAKLKKPISYFPVTRKAYWQIGNGAVRANGVKTDASALQVIVDTGTTLVYAPNATVAKMFAPVRGARYWTEGYWTFPCASVPTIGWSFGSDASTPVFNMTADSLNLGRKSSSSPDCVSAIVGQSFAGSAVLLGDAFLKNVVSVFDLGTDRVGFAYLAPKTTAQPTLALSRGRAASTTTTSSAPTSTSTSTSSSPASTSTSTSTSSTGALVQVSLPLSAPTSSPSLALRRGSSSSSRPSRLA